jgi:hypothetical protein
MLAASSVACFHAEPPAETAPEVPPRHAPESGESISSIEQRLHIAWERLTVALACEPTPATELETTPACSPATCKELCRLVDDVQNTAEQVCRRARYTGPACHVARSDQRRARVQSARCRCITWVDEAL